MAEERINIDLVDKSEEKLATKLYKDQFNDLQLEKSVNTKVTELIKPLPNAKLDLVPRPVYDAEVQLNDQLNKQIELLDKQIADLTEKLNQKTSDSGSLYVNNDFLKLQNATLENQLSAQNNIVSELRTSVATSIQKSISENAERTALEAENAGLVAQKTALLKQIDTLNNLVSAAQKAVSQTQEAVGNFNQIGSQPGAKKAGNLIAVAPAKDKPQEGQEIEYNRAKSGQSVGTNTIIFGSSRFTVAAGAKDVNVVISASGGPNNVWTPRFVGSNTATIKAGQTYEFKLQEQYTDGIDNNAWTKGSGGFVNYDFPLKFTATTSDGTDTQSTSFTIRLNNV